MSAPTPLQLTAQRVSRCRRCEAQSEANLQRQLLEAIAAADPDRNRRPRLQRINHAYLASAARARHQLRLRPHGAWVLCGRRCKHSSSRCGRSSQVALTLIGGVKNRTRTCRQLHSICWNSQTGEDVARTAAFLYSISIELLILLHSADAPSMGCVRRLARKCICSVKAS